APPIRPFPRPSLPTALDIERQFFRYSARNRVVAFTADKNVCPMPMSDIRKAAILLMSLPEEQAVTLMAKLTAKQVEQVSIEIAKLGRLSGDEQENVIHEFADANPNAMGLAGGGLDVAKALVEKALGSKATSTLDVVRQSIEALPFGFLKKVDPQ